MCGKRHLNWGGIKEKIHLAMAEAEQSLWNTTGLKRNDPAQAHAQPEPTARIQASPWAAERGQLPPVGSVWLCLTRSRNHSRCDLPALPHQLPPTHPRRKNQVIHRVWEPRKRIWPQHELAAPWKDAEGIAACLRTGSSASEHLNLLREEGLRRRCSAEQRRGAMFSAAAWGGPALVSLWRCLQGLEPAGGPKGQPGDRPARSARVKPLRLLFPAIVCVGQDRLGAPERVP